MCYLLHEKYQHKLQLVAEMRHQCKLPRGKSRSGIQYMQQSSAACTRVRSRVNAVTFCKMHLVATSCCGSTLKPNVVSRGMVGRDGLLLIAVRIGVGVSFYITLQPCLDPIYLTCTGPVEYYILVLGLGSACCSIHTYIVKNLHVTYCMTRFCT